MHAIHLPALLSTFITLCFELNSAVCKGVFPCSSLFALSALLSNSTRTQSTFPLKAAKCNGVYPLLVQQSGSPPCSNNKSSSLEWPLLTASCIGVYPSNP